MKQKKIILTGALVLALSLAACAGENTLGVVKNQETGAILALGMTQEEVEAALKISPEETAQRPDKEWPELDYAKTTWQISYGTLENLISVCYDWDTGEVVQLGVDQFPSNWVLDGAIGTEATKEKIKKQYGEPSYPEEKTICRRDDGTKDYGVGLSYCYDADGKQTDGTTSDMFLTFTMDPSGALDQIGVVKYDEKYTITGEKIAPYHAN